MTKTRGAFLYSGRAMTCAMRSVNGLMPVAPGWPRTLRKRERLAAGEAWEDSGQMFTDELGRPLHPEFVSRRFRELAAAAGLPVIKFHAARHTAATLALKVGVDVKIVAEQLGHSTTRITQDLYQHVRLQVHQDSAEKVKQLLPERVKRAQVAHS